MGMWFEDVEDVQAGPTACTVNCEVLKQIPSAGVQQLAPAPAPAQLFLLDQKNRARIRRQKRFALASINLEIQLI